MIDMMGAKIYPEGSAATYAGKEFITGSYWHVYEMPNGDRVELHPNQWYNGIEGEPYYVRVIRKEDLVED